MSIKQRSAKFLSFEKVVTIGEYKSESGKINFRRTNFLQCQSWGKAKQAMLVAYSEIIESAEYTLARPGSYSKGIVIDTAFGEVNCTAEKFGDTLYVTCFNVDTNNINIELIDDKEALIDVRPFVNVEVLYSF